MPTIAIVGSGPTALYTLAALRGASLPLDVTIFEALPEAGRGTPYSPGLNSPLMLSNIASLEIPPMLDTLVAWLDRQPDTELQRLGVPRGDIDERAFYPRVVLGEYLKAQFEALLVQARADGHRVRVLTGHRVTDAELLADGVSLTVETSGAPATRQAFDHVVLATGHSWPDRIEPRPGYFASPWPAEALTRALGRIGPVRVGVRGTSLSAIDAAVNAASNHGMFLRDEAGVLRYHPGQGSEGFSLTLMSRKGLLPEADFYYPLPYEPLATCTEEAVAALVRSGRADLLDAVYALFAQELAACDPGYAAGIGLASLTVETFADAYFAEREGRDVFAWATLNLAEAKANQARRHTVPWRYAILRMHEVVALVAPHLGAEDLTRFHKRFKPVFVDDYATVPHQSIERLLALHAAGKLEVLRLGHDTNIDTEGPEPGAVVTLNGRLTHYPAFIEAMGQESLGAEKLPFPTLLQQGVVRRAQACRGIALDEAFRLSFPHALCRELYCLALPFLLHQHPFSQGITSSHELGTCVGQAILESIGSAGAGTAMAVRDLEAEPDRLIAA